jgi:hypothetical protein
LSGASQPSEAGGPDLATGGEEASAGAEDSGSDGPGRLRRRLLGRDRRQTDRRASEPAAASGSEIAEVRRDIAALWIAFNQHERSLRDLAGRLEASLGALAPPLAPEDATPAESELPGPPAAVPSGDEISDQLADLDEVLAAIERATQVLEHTHADELERRPTATGPSEGEGGELPDGPDRAEPAAG